jgi:hypothetical protein
MTRTKRVVLVVVCSCAWSAGCRSGTAVPPGDGFGGATARTSAEAASHLRGEIEGTLSGGFVRESLRATCVGRNVASVSGVGIIETDVWEAANGDFEARKYRLGDHGDRALTCIDRRRGAETITACPEGSRRYEYIGSLGASALLTLGHPVTFSDGLMGLHLPLQVDANALRRGLWSGDVEWGGADAIDGVDAVRVQVPYPSGHSTVWLERSTGMRVRVESFNNKGELVNVWGCQRTSEDMDVDDGATSQDLAAAGVVLRVEAVRCSPGDAGCGEDERDDLGAWQAPVGWAVLSSTVAIETRIVPGADPDSRVAAVTRQIDLGDGTTAVLLQRPSGAMPFLPRVDDWLRWTKCGPVANTDPAPVLYVGGDLGESYLWWMEAASGVESLLLPESEGAESLVGAAAALGLSDVSTCGNVIPGS